MQVQTADENFRVQELLTLLYKRKHIVEIPHNEFIEKPELLLARIEDNKLYVSRKICNYVYLASYWHDLISDSRCKKCISRRLLSGLIYNKSAAKNKLHYCAKLDLSETYDPEIIRGKKNYSGGVYLPDFQDEIEERGGKYKKNKQEILGALQGCNMTSKTSKLIRSMYAYKNDEKRYKRFNGVTFPQKLRDWLSQNEHYTRIEIRGKFTFVWVPVSHMEDFTEARCYYGKEYKFIQKQKRSFWSACFIEDNQCLE